MAPPLLTLKSIALTFGGAPLLVDAELSVAAGDRVSLVGRNGSGKSTLLKIAAGLVEPDRGERFELPSAIVRYLAQEADFNGFASARAVVEAQIRPLDNPATAMKLLAELGFAGDEDPATLSGGEARRLAIAAALVARPDVLLLDEPTNHLDLPTIEWLERRLSSERAAIVLVSHDRRFLERLSRVTVWLDRGHTRRLEQGFSAYETWRDELIEQEEAERHKLDRKIARENDWMHGGVTGRRKRNVRRVRELQVLRQTKAEARHVEGNVAMVASTGETSGKVVVETKAMSKAYGGRAIVDRLSVRVARGDRLGVVGANGAGKTTLLQLLTGVLAADSGEVRLGQGLEMVTLDQNRDALDLSATLGDTLTGGGSDQVMVNGHARHVTSYMRDFLFSADQMRSPVRVLSGGERARLMLARALAKPSNLLVLDEPTNDLDLETLDLLQELIAGYPGTVLLVSHDRDFLDRIATSVIAADGGGRWIEYAGGYTDMLAQRRGADLVRAETRTGAEVRATKAPAARGGVAPRARKLSFKDKHALETLPAAIETWTADVARLEARLAEPDFYARDRAAFERLSGEIGNVRARLAKAEDDWLALELLREEFEG